MIPVNKKAIFAIEQSELKLQKSMPLNGFFYCPGLLTFLGSQNMTTSRYGAHSALECQL